MLTILIAQIEPYKHLAANQNIAAGSENLCKNDKNHTQIITKEKNYVSIKR